VGNALVLYDGVCGLCNRGVQFVLRHDEKGRFRLASLQSEFAKGVLARHGVKVDLDTVYVVVNGGSADESLLARSDAVLFVLRGIGGLWRVGAWLLKWLPRRVRDWGYHWIARHRYRIFGRYETCPIPSERERSRFLDL
jgi:predicted DCC family thiol-disulfide oxidoreductase YuxK